MHVLLQPVHARLIWLPSLFQLSLSLLSYPLPLAHCGCMTHRILEFIWSLLQCGCTVGLVRNPVGHMPVPVNGRYHGNE
jgi:hypothetical protein